MEEDSLMRLQRGNASYVKTGVFVGDVGPLCRFANREGQHPFAAVVACADSRVVPEAIFSAGLGELFVIRVAGNVVDKTQLASLRYAVEHLGVDTVVILGHTGCGAIAAALDDGEHDDVAYLVRLIRASVGREKNAEKATCLHVQATVDKVRADLSSAVRVVGAVYDTLSGVVRFL